MEKDKGNANEENEPILRIPFEVIDKSEYITDTERQDFYREIMKFWWGHGILKEISAWLSELDIKRALLESPSFIDEL